MTATLPAGGTVERVRAVSGDEAATMLSLERLVVTELPGQVDYAPLRPVIILGFHDLCLLRAEDDDDWYMGQVDAEGSVICWASYGSDLGEAIQGLCRSPEDRAG